MRRGSYESFNKKHGLHLGCGTVYLKDTEDMVWTNIDLELSWHYLASERSDLVKQNGTTVDRYYKYDVNKGDFKSGKFHKKEVVCDMFSDVRLLPFRKNSIDEILAMHLFEHFNLADGKELLKYWFSLLKKGGYIRLHVPDTEGILEEYSREKDLDWTIRQLYGSQKNEFGVHGAGYTKDSLAKLFVSIGLTNVEILPNINNHPAFGIKGYRV